MRASLSFVLLLSFTACGDGTPGPRGPAGDPGDPGASGDGGAPGRNAYLTGPGLTMQITGATIAEDGTATATFRITDGSGKALDRAGLYTAGEVAVSFVLARLGAGVGGEPGQYVPLTTRTQEANGVSAVQGSADTNGTFAEVEPIGSGTYLYTFGTKVQTDRAATHTVGAWATRTFEEKRYVSNALHHFVPAGGTASPPRELARTETCNSCHGTLQAHGGSRREVGLCVTCHTAGGADPDTGNSIDMDVMVHKIHMGEHLPSVEAGGTYQIVGFRNAVHDYSKVVFPRDIRGCAACHSGAQPDAWKTRPSRESCGSCHDLTAFEEPVPSGMELHTGGPQPHDSTCATCHPPVGGIAGIEDSHRSGASDPAVQDVTVEIQSIANTGPGQRPTVTFRVTVDGAPRDVIANPMTRIGATVAGPVTDYGSYFDVVLQGGGAAGTLTAVNAADGVFRYEFPATGAIPLTATGSWALAMEAYLQPTGAPRSAAYNPVTYFAVTGSSAEERRVVVDVQRCNACHGELQAHGGARKNPQHCAMCHNANNTNDDRVARFEDSTVLASGVHLKHMIHRLHMGEHLTQKPYVLGGFPAPSVTNPAGAPIDFSHVVFPNQIQNCQACHVAGTYELPLPAGLLPTREEVLTCTEPAASDANAHCATRSVTTTYLYPPATSACTSCHDSPDAMAHAMVNTAANGVEACAACHGRDREFAVEKMHEPAP